MYIDAIYNINCKSNKKIIEKAPSDTLEELSKSSSTEKDKSRFSKSTFGRFDLSQPRD